MARIGVIGMGYVGLTMAAALTRAGHVVIGVDSRQEVIDGLRRGKVHLFEPGVSELLAEHTGKRLLPASELPDEPLDIAVICVSTPTSGLTTPDLRNVADAAEHVARRCGPDTLVVVRSTVPVGTSRGVVLPKLLEAWGRASLVMAPERTIQGKALRELTTLPQVLGGLNETSLAAAQDLFRSFVTEVVAVSSLEAAELVKLTNNCHTDLIYAFGNEIAMVADHFGLDPLEVIHAANIGYPRPDIARPGYVGGGCLSKDPYLLIDAARQHGYEPFLVGQAPRLNEHLPEYVAERIVRFLGRDAARSTVYVLGWAYKGRPPTDDTRGAPVDAMVPVFRRHGITVTGHDPLVAADDIIARGGIPVDPAAGFAKADAVLLVTDHPCYRDLDLEKLLAKRRPGLIFDSWRILDEVKITSMGITYAGLGYVAPSDAR